MSILTEAWFVRAIAGDQMEILSQVLLEQNHYAFTVRGVWLGRLQTRHFVAYKKGSTWNVVQLPNDWIATAAHLQMPALPTPQGEEEQS